MRERQLRAAGSRRRAHIQARPSQAGGGRRRRRERTRPALSRCLRAAPAARGAGGALRGPEERPGRAGGRVRRRGAARAAAAARGAKSEAAAAATGQRRPCAEGGRREREEEEEGAPRRLLPGGSLRLPDCRARLSSSATGRLVQVPPPPPPPRWRGTLRESLFLADRTGARRGGRCSGRGAKRAARGRRRLLAGAGGRRRSGRGCLGSGPRSARGRLPLPPAQSSSELHQRPSPAPRARWLDGWQEGAAAAPGPLAPHFAPRLRGARLLQTLSALGAGLPRCAEPEPPVPPPLLRPAPRAPPLIAPPLHPAPGPPGGGAVPGRDIDSCRSPWGSGPGSPGRLPGIRARRELQRPEPSPQLRLAILR